VKQTNEVIFSFLQFNYNIP